jgi:hypothetical protein
MASSPKAWLVARSSNSHVVHRLQRPSSWTSASLVVPEMNTLIMSASTISGSSLHCLEKRRMYSCSLSRFLFAGFETLGVFRVHVCALEFPYKDALEVCPRVDAVCGQMLEPCSGAFRKVEQQVLDDEEIIVRPACSTSEAEVFQSYGGVGVSVVLTIFGGVRKHAGNGVCQILLRTPAGRSLAGVRTWAASSVPNPGMSTMVVWVTVTIV